ncbi:uncharacterized protein [Malus domestica]|uniref:uncharacterized protein n=1 Tax=Malus domestica TaxID=3750 RepID=UPI0010AA7491|nr:uncharacterized protein LOC114819295 [Malus domestica]
MWFQQFPEFQPNPLYISGVLCWSLCANSCFSNCRSLYESPWWTAAKNPYKSALSQLIAVEYDSRDIYRHRLQLIGSTLSQVKCLIHVVKAGAFKSSNARPFLLVNTKLSNIRLGLLVLQLVEKASLVLVVAVEWQSTKAGSGIE